MIQAVFLSLDSNPKIVDGEVKLVFEHVYSFKVSNFLNTAEEEK